MSEVRDHYIVKEPNPTGIPHRWLNFLSRCARLEGGRTYNFVLIVPADDGDPIWALLSDGKLENGIEKKKPRYLGDSE